MSLLDRTNFAMCTKCTICTEYCPVSQYNPVYPGPKQSGPDGERLRLKDPDYYDDALKYCTNCKRCEVNCPSGVNIGDIIQLARKKYGKRRFSLRDAILGHTDLMGGLGASPLARVVNAAAGLAPVKTGMEKMLGIPSARILPRYSTGYFRRWFKRHAEAKQQAFAEQAALFHGCYINYNNPDLGKAVVTVLNAFGVGVNLLEKERCCGIPLIAGGFFNQARKNALSNSVSISKAVGLGMPVVVPSPSCVMTLRDEYPHILEVANSAWRARVDLLSRFLYRLWASGKEIALKPVKLRVAYHTACHIEKLGWTCYSINMLQRIPGLEVVILPSRCCGIAGTYGFKSENYETARKIGAELFASIEASGADLVICDCEMCKMQIEQYTGKPCEHPVSIMARSLAG